MLPALLERVCCLMINFALLRNWQVSDFRRQPLRADDRSNIAPTVGGSLLPSLVEILI